MIALQILMKQIFLGMIYLEIFANKLSITKMELWFPFSAKPPHNGDLSLFIKYVFLKE